MDFALRALCSAFLASLLAVPSAAHASYGLRASRELVEQQLFTELTALLGHGASHERLARIEDVLRPMYSALPKTEGGGIDQGVARYALNRYFLTYHGWHITGIAPDGEGWDTSSSTTMLQSRMPTLTLEVLEERVGRKHVSLGELAVLAATVEDLVHSDGLAVLRMAYEALNFSMDSPLRNEQDEDLVIRTFMLFFTMPWTQDALDSRDRLDEYLQNAHQDNPAWNANMLWAEDMKQTEKYQHSAEHNPFLNDEVYFGNYHSMVQLAERIIDGFGVFQDVQCKELKNTMMHLEDQERDDGRVLLANFYTPFFNDEHEFFVERPEYLKHLGSLDDSDPIRPSVIVPNFLYGRQFCLAADNDFQSFCCVDQCNFLMESLERSIAHPVASPGLIAKLVSDLFTDTVAAPRNLSGSLRQKLDLIAEPHGGSIPLHGRMFAQWLHHAFPNECPQPRALGATEAPMTHDEWRTWTNTSSVVSKEEVQELKDRAAEAGDIVDAEESSMLWTGGEELLTSLSHETLGSTRAEPEQGRGGMARTVLRFMAMFFVAVSALAILIESVRSSASSLWPKYDKGTYSLASKLPR